MTWPEKHTKSWNVGQQLLVGSLLPQCRFGLCLPWHPLVIQLTLRKVTDSPQLMVV